MSTTGFDAFWLAEIIRLRETQGGSLDDAQAMRHARAAPGSAQTKLLHRATLIASREGMDVLIGRWKHGARVALGALVIMALIAGTGTALGALGDGATPVNVIWALGALLGLHTITFVLWLLAFLLPSGVGTGALGSVWLAIARKLARGPNATLAPQALMGLLARLGALRWAFGAVSHLVWLIALSSALGAMLVVLSTARYEFVWATTLLDPERFVQLTHSLGWLPQQFGFTVPDASIVRASASGSSALTAGAQVQWSVWLLGMVVVYGIAPRLIAWVACLVALKAKCRRVALDFNQPGYAALIERLDEPPASGPVDGPPGTLTTRPLGHYASTFASTGAPTVVALELADDIVWPVPGLVDATIDNPAERLAPQDAEIAGAPAGTPDRPAIQDAGILDSRAQRNRVLEALTRAPVSRLLIACDARQTPDRGALALIADLSSTSRHTAVWLIEPAALLAPHSAPEGATRAAQWHAQLRSAGLPETDIFTDLHAASAWIQEQP